MGKIKFIIQQISIKRKLNPKSKYDDVITLTVHHPQGWTFKDLTMNNDLSGNMAKVEQTH